VNESTARKLLDLGVGRAVLTLGSKGALVVTPEETGLVPGRKVTAVDTTAAGDAFTGAFAVRLAAGEDIVSSVEYACAAAAISVTRMGAQSSLPTAQEVEALWLQDRHGIDHRALL
jgi:ribokinase